MPALRTIMKLALLRSFPSLPLPTTQLRQRPRTVPPDRKRSTVDDDVAESVLKTD